VGSQYEALAQVFEPLEAADDVAGVAEVVAAFVVDVVDFAAAADVVVLAAAADVVDLAAAADVVDAFAAADVLAAGACPDCKLPLLSQ